MSAYFWTYLNMPTDCALNKCIVQNYQTKTLTCKMWPYGYLICRKPGFTAMPYFFCFHKTCTKELRLIIPSKDSLVGISDNSFRITLSVFCILFFIRVKYSNRCNISGVFFNNTSITNFHLLWNYFYSRYAYIFVFVCWQNSSSGFLFKTAYLRCHFNVTHA